MNNPILTLSAIRDDDYDNVSDAVDTMVEVCHSQSFISGWWKDRKTGEDIREQDDVLDAKVPEKLMLIVSELSEAMEGHRKGLKDEHIKDLTSFEVELADALIRICDLAGAKGISLGQAVSRKLQYNAVRPDHKPEVRNAEGGKRY